MDIAESLKDAVDAATCRAPLPPTDKGVIFRERRATLNSDSVDLDRLA